MITKTKWIKKLGS